MPPTDPLLLAASFAARAHRHQLRKDGQTPYSAHVVRVCLVASQVFGISDPPTLCAALLHDTLEDTTTDFDDLAEHFGTDVAGWVAALSKDTRRPDDDREAEYKRTLAVAPWQVQVCKLADIYDNLTDSVHLTPDKRARTLQRTADYLAALKSALKPEAEKAFGITEARRTEVAKGGPTS